ncbi:MAG TPA: PAS and ANTAR domain-containing protein [Cellulomonas sp.]
MASNPNDVTSALTAGIAHETGAFTYDVSADRWWWSDEVFRMHGFEPGEVVPTTAMILAHKHPDDRDRYAGALTSTSLLGGSFASVHRILDARGEERVLATIGEAHQAGPGTPVTEITGHFVDVTASVRALAADEATRQIHAADERRAVIDQATGVVAARTGLTVPEAFDLLRGASMRSNVKLRVLAERVVTNARGRSSGSTEDWLGQLGDPSDG